MRSIDVLDRPRKLLLERGTTPYIPSDNGPEPTARLPRSRLRALGVTTHFIEPGIPRENGGVESVSGRLR
jgi:transposase InsO family protein